MSALTRRVRDRSCLEPYRVCAAKNGDDGSNAAANGGSKIVPKWSNDELLLAVQGD